MCNVIFEMHPKLHQPISIRIYGWNESERLKTGWLHYGWMDGWTDGWKKAEQHRSLQCLPNRDRW